jgi:hypothetical protein
MRKFLPSAMIFIAMSLCTSAFITSIDELRSNYLLIAVNLLTALLVIVISVGLFKFINITRKNKAFVTAYFVIAMLLLSSVINILYFFSGSQTSYWLIYMIDRTIIFIILVVIFFGYRKFRKALGTKI